MKVAVVGHIEWCHFAVVDHIPNPGEIVGSTRSWTEAAGGGGVAAAQLASLAGNCLLFTAVGDDEIGRQSLLQLKQLGIEVYASVLNDTPTREAFVHIDPSKDRAITVMGTLTPSGDDATLPWEKLATVDAVYFVSGDTAALNYARHAAKVVSTSRILPTLQEAAVKIDTLVMSQKDQQEHYKIGDLTFEPVLTIKTNGKAGGETSKGVHYKSEVVPFEEIKDTYGCGDSFAAGLTFAAAQNLNLAETLKLAAHCGAMATRRSGAHEQKF